MASDLVLVSFGDSEDLASTLRSAGNEPKIVSIERLADIAAPEAKQPSAVVIDMRTTSELPLSLAGLMRNHPTTGVMIVASKLDPVLMLEAMRLGVTEFMAEPVSEVELGAAITRIRSTAKSAEHVARVIAFVGAKGGVGTTTLAVNVATTISMLSAGNTLFVDLHMMSGDAAVFLGAEPRFSVVDALENSHRLDDTFFKSLITRCGSGLDLLASSDHVVSTLFDSSRLRALIDFVACRYRFVILDVPRFDPVVLDSLHRVGAIVIVTSQEVASARSAGRLSMTLGQLYGREKVKLVVGRANSATEIGREEMERALGTTIRHEIPSDYKMALQALNAGRPLALENHNTLSSSIHKLARELCGISDKGKAARKQGLFGRLAGRRA